MLVAYVFYSGPVLALGSLLMQIASNCDKHANLLIYKLIPVAFICFAALVLGADSNPDSGNLEFADEYRGVELSNGSVCLPEQSETSRVL